MRNGEKVGGLGGGRGERKNSSMHVEYEKIILKEMQNLVHGVLRG